MEHPGGLDRLRAVARLADHLESGSAFRIRRKPVRTRVLIVGEQEAELMGAAER